MSANAFLGTDRAGLRDDPEPEAKRQSAEKPRKARVYVVDETGACDEKTLEAIRDVVAKRK